MSCALAMEQRKSQPSQSVNSRGNVSEADPDELWGSIVASER